MKFQRILTITLTLLMLLSAIGLVSCDAEQAQKEAYGVTIGSVAIEIDAKAEPILAALGEWKTYDASPTCAFEGEDKIYGYGSFEIRTYTLGGVDYVHSVYLLDDTYSTREGLSVGSARDAVVSACGTPTEESASALIYRTDEMQLSFLLRDGVVTNIQYVKSENS